MDDTASIKSNTKPVILVIDDSKLVRVSIRRVLKNEFQILEAVDGEDGWKKLLEDDSIQVVITDAGMPRLDGFELIERIRNSDIARVKEVPIMMVTGAEKAQTEVRERALGLGATDFITKPFDNVQMLARTRTHAKLDDTQRSLDKTANDLVEKSATDTLTDACNRRYFLQRGNQELAYANRHKQALSFIAFGIDNFSQIGSQYGQQTSNAVQIWLTKLVNNILRKEDTLARVNEGLFAVIAPSASRMDAAVLCERMRKKVESTSFSETVISLPMTISLGITCLGTNNFNSSEKFLVTAIKLIEQAQQRGGNRIVAGTAAKPAVPTLHTKPRPSVDTALALLDKGEKDSLNPYIVELTGRVLPILEHGNKTLNWGVDELILALKQKISENYN